MFLNCGTSLLVVIQIHGIKLQKSCEHVRAYGLHNILWRATCGLRAVVCPPLLYVVLYSGKRLEIGNNNISGS